MDNTKTPKQFAPELAKALSAVTGDKWRVEPEERDYSHYSELWSSDGVRLGIGSSRSKDAFHISPNFNHFVGSDGRPVRGSYGEPQVEMNVSRDKDAYQVARDILRRILVECRRLSQEYARRAVEDRSYGLRVKATAEQVAAVVGARVLVGGPHQNPDPSQARIDLYRSTELPECLGDLKPGDGTLTFERFEVGADEAVAMLEALIRKRKR